ncbi:S41A family C-terminal processing peptidase-3 [Novosphingobium kunmingense]|uniref:S41A family C-terminal processing peptidase-3 n=1 Tax=Novosphingobium kunmingense TaxID=1211806 RepID=A0A2N0H569_9SPHN|nr:S41 family peptidase [Novosphingobium kunmingense]PKB14063.1 S41A family C-terminal processing peptidase-3 [Novosphingobium kunmingense]
MKFAPLFRASLLVTAVALIPATTAGLAAVDGRAGPEFGRLLSVYQMVKSQYVEKVDDDKLINGAIDGMLAALDPHSTYLEGSTLTRLTTMIDGKYSGLGLSVEMDDGAVKVISPMRGSPAEASGVKAGDFITHLDGKLIYGGELDDAVSQMRGEAGTKIRLTIFRPGREQPFDLTVTRGVITLEPVTWKLEKDVGVITVNEFSRDVGVNVNRAIADLRKQTANKLSGLVLDLRSNPGGSLDEAVALSDLFLTKGDIVSQRGRNPQDNEFYKAESIYPGDAAKGLPVIVLIDAGSASASEIVAGALQDQNRAVIMGERSFGKGSVQSLFELDRSHAVKLTTARYFTPSGRSVQEGGIDPDIRVPQLSDPDAQRRNELALRESDLRRHLVNEVGIDDKKLEADRQADPRFKQTAEDLKTKGIKDFQLYYAMETLRRTSGVALAAKGK